jgi:hypothetical protein
MVLTFRVVPSGSGEDQTIVSIAGFMVDARAKRKTFVPMNIEMQFIEKHKILYLDLHRDLSKSNKRCKNRCKIANNGAIMSKNSE